LCVRALCVRVRAPRVCVRAPRVRAIDESAAEAHSASGSGPAWGQGRGGQLTRVRAGKLLEVNPSRRLSAAKALQHPWLAAKYA
jgi:hypothetical protein